MKKKSWRFVTLFLFSCKYGSVCGDFCVVDFGSNFSSFFLVYWSFGDIGILTVMKTSLQELYG